MTAARERARRLRSEESELAGAAAAAARPPSLRSALVADTVGVIAEIKRRSPSSGAINAELDCAARAALYARGGARALSVLTEPTEFGGGADDLRAAAAACALPILKKDFHVEPIQMLEARALGASAALLIVRALSPSELDTMAAAARDAGVEILAEVRDEDELARAIAIGADLIGVNNRNLETLEIDRDTCSRIIPSIPSDRVAVAESGMSTGRDVAAAAEAGADAVLIGSALSAASDPLAALRPLVSVARIGRGA